MTKICVGRTTLNEEKKEDDLKAKKISHVLSWRQTCANGVTWVHIVASFILEIIPLQVSCKAMIGDYELHGAFSLTRPLDLLKEKRKVLCKKKIQLPQNWFGTPTWLRFY